MCVHLYSGASECVSTHPLEDLGGVPGACPLPPESRFFHFDIQNVQNITASGVAIPPPLRGRRPPHGKTGKPGSAAAHPCTTEKKMDTLPFNSLKITVTRACAIVPEPHTSFRKISIS